MSKRNIGRKGNQKSTGDAQQNKSSGNSERILQLFMTHGSVEYRHILLSLQIRKDGHEDNQEGRRLDSARR